MFQSSRIVPSIDAESQGLSATQVRLSVAKDQQRTHVILEVVNANSQLSVTSLQFGFDMEGKNETELLSMIDSPNKPTSKTADSNMQSQLRALLAPLQKQAKVLFQEIYAADRTDALRRLMGVLEQEKVSVREQDALIGERAAAEGFAEVKSAIDANVTSRPRCCTIS